MQLHIRADTLTRTHNSAIMCWYASDIYTVTNVKKRL